MKPGCKRTLEPHHVIFAALLHCVTGCGTMMNLPAPCHGPDQPLRVYGGVRNDLEMAQANFKDMATAAQDVWFAKATGCTLLGLDLPLCVAVDTVLLPITIPVSLARVGKGTVNGVGGE